MDDSIKYDLDLQHLKTLYQNSSKSFSQNEIEQHMDRDYVTDSKYQLSANDIASLRKRRMPALTMNWCEKLKRCLVGIIESNPVDPIAIPQKPDSEEGATVVTKLLRYTINKAKWSQKRLDCAGDFFVEGIAVALTEIDEKTNRNTGETYYSPNVRRISPYDFFYDPTSKERDFSDASYLGVRKWITAGDLKQLYPERFAELGDPIDNNDFLSADDYTNTTSVYMVDRKNRKLCLVELYEYNEGNWNRTVFAANGVYDFQESILNNEYGESICPITAVSNIVDIRFNYRIGSIRRVRNSQDVINQALIKTAACINSRQVVQTDVSALMSPEEVRREAGRPDGIIPFGWTVQPNTDMTDGLTNLIQAQMQFMMDSIPNADVIGRITQATSGRAMLVDQEQGLIEYADMLKAISSFEEAIYRNIWYAYQEYSTADQVINISGDPKAPDYIKINHIEGFQDVLVQTPDGYVTQPQPIITNRLIDIYVDIIFQNTPASPNLQSEVFDSFMQLMQTGVQINSPEFEIALEMSPLEDKNRIRDIIAKYMGPAPVYDPNQVQAQAQAQQQQVQAQQQAQLAQLQLQAQIKQGKLMLEKLQADIDQVRSKTVMNLAQANKTQTDLEIESRYEGVELQHTIAETELKQAKANTMNQDMIHQQREHGIELHMLNNLIQP